MIYFNIKVLKLITYLCCSYTFQIILFIFLCKDIIYIHIYIKFHGEIISVLKCQWILVRFITNELLIHGTNLCRYYCIKMWETKEMTFHKYPFLSVINIFIF